MAEDVKKIINIDTSGAETALEKAKNKVTALSGSYNALNQELGELKKAWKATNDEAERDALTAQINKVKASMNTLNESIGNFHHNVGNYTNSIKAAFEQAGMSILQMKNPIAAVKKGFDLLAKTPLLLVFTSLVAIFNKLKDAFARNEEASLRLKNAMAPLQGIATLVEQAFDKLAQMVANIASAFGDLVEKFANTKLGEWLGLDKVVKQSNEIKNINELELEIERDKRDLIIEEAEAKLRIAQLDAIIEDKTKSEKERRDALVKKEEEEKAIMEKTLALRQKEYNLIVAKNSLTSSGTKDLAAESAARAAILEVETNLQNLRNGNMKKGNSITKDGESAAAREKREAKEEWEAQKTRLKNQIEVIDTRLAAEKSGNERYLELEILKLNKQRQIDETEARFRIQDAQELSETLLAIEERYTLDYGKIYNDFMLEQDRLAIQNQANLVNNMEAEIKHLPADMYKYLDEFVKLRQMVLDTTYEQADENQADWQARYDEAKRQLKEAINLRDQYASQFWKGQGDAMTSIAGANMSNGTRPYAQYIEEMKQAISSYTQAFNAMVQGIDETDEDFVTRQMEMLQLKNQTEKQLLADAVDYYSNYADAVSSILSTVGDAWTDSINRRVEAGEIGQEQAEKEFNAVKSFQYATTWINTLASVSQIMADTSIPTYYAKAALAAAQLTQGIAQTIAIKNTKLGGTGGGAVNTGAVSAVAQPVINESTPYTYTRNLTTASEEEQSLQPIYVSVVDIENAQEQRKARVTEATW